MMKLEAGNRQDWQGFSRILEVMSFVDEVEDFTPEQARETFEGFCQLPPNPGQTMSMEEVVFWAGVAAGMQICEHSEDGRIDPETAEKLFIFSSIFAHSTKNAIVDLVLGEMERPEQSVLQKTGRR